MNEGVVFWQEKNVSEAETLFGRAETVLLSMSPSAQAASFEFEPRLCQLYMNWGGLLFELGRSKQAIERLDQGLQRAEPRLRNEPNDAAVKRTCLELHGNRGFALSALGKHRESAEEWQRVSELSEQTVPSDVRVRLAMELLESGETERALSQSRTLKNETGISVIACYNLCCLLARNTIARTGLNTRPDQSKVDELTAEALRRLPGGGECRVLS